MSKNNKLTILIKYINLLIMDDEKYIKQLLSQVYDINKSYEEKAKQSGENFNIFNILDLTTKEIIHSKFIAMLLDPRGKHGQGNLFLKLFINTISLNDCISDDYINANEKLKEIITQNEENLIAYLDIINIGRDVIIEYLRLFQNFRFWKSYLRFNGKSGF